MLRFEVHDVEEGVATTLARKLRENLIEAGADPDQLTMTRANPQNMDWGSVLQFVTSADTWSVAQTGIEIAGIAHTVFSFVRRNGTVITIKTDKGSVTIPPSVSTVEEVVAEIEKAMREDGKPR